MLNIKCMCMKTIDLIVKCGGIARMHHLLGLSMDMGFMEKYLGESGGMLLHAGILSASGAFSVPNSLIHINNSIFVCLLACQFAHTL